MLTGVMLSTRTVAYDDSYGVVRRLVRYHTMICRTVAYDDSYGAVRRLVRYRTAARTVSYDDVPYVYRTTRRTAPYETSYDTIRYIIVRHRTGTRTVPYDGRRTVTYGPPYSDVRRLVRNRKARPSGIIRPCGPICDILTYY